MSTVSSIINVTITRNTAAVSQAGFGTLMIAGVHTAFPERLRFYETAAAVAADFPSTAAPERIAAEMAFAQTPRPQRVAIGKMTAPGTGITIGGELSAIQAYNDDWYGLVLTSQTLADQTAAAAWINARPKIFMARTNAAGVIDSTSTTDIAAVAKTAAYDRVAVVYHNPSVDDYIGAAWLGKMLPQDPGSATFAFKSLSGVAADSLTATQETAVLDKNANIYTPRGGVNVTYNGKMASGEYIDVIVGTDWLQARIQERVYARLVNLKKIPYTDAGVAIIESEIRAQLAEGVRKGLLAATPEPTVAVPLVADISANDKANRFLPDISFSATLAGAVHKTQINGTVSV